MHDQAVLGDVTGKEAQWNQDCGFILEVVFRERKMLFSRRVTGYRDCFGSHPAPNPVELQRREPALQEMCKDRAHSDMSELLQELYIYM